MNWLQKICQTKSMPLPVVYNQPLEDSGPDNWKPPGITNIDQLMTQETANQELRRDPNIDYFGAGVHGVATHSKGLVRKYVNTRQEAINAWNAMKNPRSFLIAIRNVEQIQEDPPLWAIDSEKVKHLTQKESEIATEITEELLDNERILDPDELIEAGFDPQIVDKVFYDYMKFINGISEDPQFTWGDAWGENLGYTQDGRLVLLDLGGADDEGMPQELPLELQLV